MSYNNDDLKAFIQSFISDCDYEFKCARTGRELAASEVFELLDLIRDDLMSAYAQTDKARFIQVCENELFNYDVSIERTVA